MALIHRATIRPTKAELATDWVPTQPWGEQELDLVGAYRFDDPDGEVGIESHVLSAAGGHLLHAPLTYRGAPLDGAERFLICTMEHSVLGLALDLRRDRRPRLCPRARVRAAGGC